LCIERVKKSKRSQKNEDAKKSRESFDPTDQVKKPEGEPEPGSIGSTLWSFLSSRLGTDVLVSGISLPSWLYEPLTILQRSTEMIEYGNLLSEAANCEDALERFGYVCAFAVSGFSPTQRYKPNFNPLLGETFEYVDQRNGTQFFAEQVCHHPPTSALHAINKSGSCPWHFWQNFYPTTKFLGNSMDINTHGHSHILFEDNNDHFFYTNPETRVHNIILGTMWIEHYGELRIRNLNGSAEANMTFTKSGLFQGCQYKISGYIVNSKGKKLVKLEGRWDTYLDVTWLVNTKKVPKGTTRRLWELPTNLVPNPKTGLPPFSASLNDFDDRLLEILLPTDSRRRLDRLFLEKGDSDTATLWKKIMEDRQRMDRKKRTNEWTPLWFKQIDDETHETKKKCGCTVVITGNNAKKKWLYWKPARKKKRVSCFILRKCWDLHVIL